MWYLAICAILFLAVRYFVVFRKDSITNPEIKKIADNFVKESVKYFVFYFVVILILGSALGVI